MPFTVIKRDSLGVETYRYSGELVKRGPTWVCVRAPFVGRDRVDLGCVVFVRGDIFTEWHYSDRWYNVFRTEDTGGRLKGWYCNVVRPAEIGPDSAAADDLALDVFVEPNGTTHLLDEDEFADLDLTDAETAAAWAAVDAIKTAVAARDTPFAGLR